LVGYFFLIKQLEYGWSSISSYEKSINEKISVVVAFRNESNDIVSLCNQLLNQDIKNEVEFILVDDHSQDDSYSKLKAIKGIVLLRSDGQGKKAAINTGINHASGSIIVTTDADCSFKSSWLTSVLSPFTDKEVKMVVGPVVLVNNLGSFFGYLQTLEFASLIGSGAGAIALDKAFMCNGANLAFRKDVYQSTKMDIASGDDVFLMHHIKRNKGKIVFVKNRSAIVATNIKQNVSSFIDQRLRWSAKSTSYTDIHAILISLLVFGANFFILLSLIMLDFKLALTLIIIKFFADISFLKKLSMFFEIKKWSLYFLCLQLVYPYYIVYIAILSQLKSYNWKGRVLKK